MYTCVGIEGSNIKRNQRICVTPWDEKVRSIPGSWIPVGCKSVSPTFWRTTLGTDAATKTDEFSEKFQKAFAPTPTHFRKIILKISHSFTLKKPCLKVPNLQYKFLDWKYYRLGISGREKKIAWFGISSRMANVGRTMQFFTNPHGVDRSLQREGNDEDIVGSRPSAKNGANCATTIFIVLSLNVVIVQCWRVLVFGSTIVVIRSSEVGEGNVDKFCGRCGHF